MARERLVRQVQARPWAGAALLLLLAVAVRAIDLERLPVADELWTFLAAQGWLETGAPRIGDGIYDRAQAYTLLLAGWLAAFGETMVSARTLPLVAGSCLVVAVFLWTARAAGPLAAWIAGVFLALAPLSVDVSQFNRFYALHGLVFWLSAVGTYALVTRWHPPNKRLVVALGTIVGFMFALHLQILTAIGLVGLGLWLVLTVGIPWLRAQDPRRRQVVLAATGGLVLLAAAALLLSGAAEALLERYRSAPLWNRAHRNEFWYYHVYMVERWPTLWSLTPLGLLMALVHRPKPAVFCACVFVASFVLLSFGGMKDPRYMFFALPFLAVLWGIALAKAFELIYPWVVGATDRVLRRLAPWLAGRTVRNGLIAAGVVFLLAANGGAVKALMSLAGMRLIAAEGGGVGISADAGRADWPAVEAPLQPWLDSASVVLTSRDVHFLHFFGDYDVAISSNGLSVIGGDDFDLDPRTGRPVIASTDALARIIDCFPTGLIAIDVSAWRSPVIVPDEVADVIEAQTVEIDLPPEPGVRAFRWEHPVPDSLPADCATLPEIKKRQALATGPSAVEQETAPPPHPKTVLQVPVPRSRDATSPATTGFPPIDQKRPERRNSPRRCWGRREKATKRELVAQSSAFHDRPHRPAAARRGLRPVPDGPATRRDTPPARHAQSLRDQPERSVRGVLRDRRSDRAAGRCPCRRVS